MTSTADWTSTRHSRWFRTWFDSFHYHKLYANRDESEAAGFIDELMERLRPGPRSTALDVGCGAGRHSKYLASKGLRVTGIDLAASSINQARRSERADLHFRRHDMRLPFGTNAYEYVFNFLTSFGYFDTPADHLMVVRNMADALNTGGTLVLDYLNVRYAEARVIPEEVKNIDGMIYRLSRWADAGHFFKRIVIHDQKAREPFEYVERVAKFPWSDWSCPSATTAPARTARCVLCLLRRSRSFASSLWPRMPRASTPRRHAAGTRPRPGSHERTPSK
jgi:SAM-dependent methyltransferase